MSRRLKTVGIIGGMGPAATLDFYAKLLAAATSAQEQDRLRILIDCDPMIPDRNAAVAGKGPSPGPRLAEIARGLERQGAEVLVMPCNTAHAFAADIRGATNLPFVSIIDVTVRAAQQSPGLERVGIVGTTGTIDSGLYQKAFGAHGITALTPDGAMRDRFMKLLYEIKAGDMGPRATGEMRAIAEDLITRGAQTIVAGCTEVPLVLSPHDIAKPLISSTDCLVDATLSAAHQ